jgi:hypothetical protein
MKKQCEYRYIDNDGMSHCDHRGNELDVCRAKGCPLNKQNKERYN